MSPGGTRVIFMLYRMLLESGMYYEQIDSAQPFITAGEEALYSSRRFTAVDHHLDPFSAAVPSWGRTMQILSNLSPHSELRS